MTKTYIKPSSCRSINEVREQIDLVDQELISLFAKRFEYVKAITKFKNKTQEEIVAWERKEFVIEQRAAWAEELGLSKDTYAQLFRLMIDHNISKEMEIIYSEK
jgi:isochorismate pyruvate lyase